MLRRCEFQDNSLEEMRVWSLTHYIDIPEFLQGVHFAAMKVSPQENRRGTGIDRAGTLKRFSARRNESL